MVVPMMVAKAIRRCEARFPGAEEVVIVVPNVIVIALRVRAGMRVSPIVRRAGLRVNHSYSRI
ncbi:hypothetical protein GCM10010454_32650 [Microbacterium arabinogalactanolyticum]